MINDDAPQVEVKKIHREEQGLSNISDDILRCGDCGKSLVIIKKVKETTEENKFKAMCDYCGGSSFIKTIIGKVYISGAEDTNLSDIQLDGTINKIFVKVKK
jgi:hypothetical protein